MSYNQEIVDEASRITAGISEYLKNPLLTADDLRKLSVAAENIGAVLDMQAKE